MRQGWEEIGAGFWVGPRVIVPGWAKLSALKDDWRRSCVDRKTWKGKDYFFPGYVFGAECDWYWGQTCCLVGPLARSMLEAAQELAEGQMQLLARTTSRKEWDSRTFDSVTGEWSFGAGDTSLSW